MPSSAPMTQDTVGRSLNGARAALRSLGETEPASWRFRRGSIRAAAVQVFPSLARNLQAAESPGSSWPRPRTTQVAQQAHVRCKQAPPPLLFLGLWIGYGHDPFL